MINGKIYNNFDQRCWEIMKIFKFFTIIFLFIFKTNNAFSLVEVDITRGNLDPLPMRFHPYLWIKRIKMNFLKY